MALVAQVVAHLGLPAPILIWRLFFGGGEVGAVPAPFTPSPASYLEPDHLHELDHLISHPGHLGSDQSHNPHRKGFTSLTGGKYLRFTLFFLLGS